MKLRVLIFAEDVAMRDLLNALLKQQGHEVQLFWGPSACPLYRPPNDEQCRCPKEVPCADAVVIDGDMADDVLTFLRAMQKRGCQVLGANRALMSSDHTGAMAEAVAGFGCHLIRKPFRLDELKSWVVACTERLTACKPPG